MQKLQSSLFQHLMEERRSLAQHHDIVLLVMQLAQVSRSTTLRFEPECMKFRVQCRAVGGQTMQTAAKTIWFAFCNPPDCPVVGYLSLIQKPSDWLINNPRLALSELWKRLAEELNPFLPSFLWKIYFRMAGKTQTIGWKNVNNLSATLKTTECIFKNNREFLFTPSTNSLWIGLHSSRFDRTGSS